MVAYGATPNKRFYIVLFLLQLYYILFLLRTFWQGALWHLGQPLINVLYIIIPITIKLYIIPFKVILARGILASGQPLLNVLYSIIPITIILNIIPFKDILAKGMVASATASPKRFI